MLLGLHYFMHHLILCLFQLIPMLADGTSSYSIHYINISQCRLAHILYTKAKHISKLQQPLP